MTSQCWWRSLRPLPEPKQACQAAFARAKASMSSCPLPEPKQACQAASYNHHNIRLRAAQTADKDQRHSSSSSSSSSRNVARGGNTATCHTRQPTAEDTTQELCHNNCHCTAEHHDTHIRIAATAGGCLKHPAASVLCHYTVRQARLRFLLH